MNLTEEGGLLDTVLQFAVPVYGVMRNIKAMEDPAQYGRGTTVGMFTNYGQSPASFGNYFDNLGQRIGGVGQSLGLPNSGFNFFGGGESVSPYGGGYGSPYTGGIGAGSIAGLGGTVDMSDSYGDSGGWSAQDESDYASEIGVADY